MNRIAATLALVLLSGGVLAQSAAQSAAPNPALSVASVRMEGGIRAGKIIGSTVYGDGNTQLGTVEDLMITPGNQVVFAIVSVGGVIGIGGKLIAVPIGQLQRAGDGKFVFAGATKDTVAAMPTFVYG